MQSLGSLRSSIGKSRIKESCRVIQEYMKHVGSCPIMQYCGWLSRSITYLLGLSNIKQQRGGGAGPG